MAIKQTALAVTCRRKEGGFVLLVAIIFMSVMLSFGLALGSLAFKQQVLASASLESQYAFYAADAALECALYADQQQDLFAYPAVAPSGAPDISCDTAVPYSSQIVSHTGAQWVTTMRLSLDAGKHCADVTAYKYRVPQADGRTTYLFSQGYNISCATVASPAGTRFASRGIHARY